MHIFLSPAHEGGYMDSGQSRPLRPSPLCAEQKKISPVRHHFASSVETIVDANTRDIVRYFHVPACKNDRVIGDNAPQTKRPPTGAMAFSHRYDAATRPFVAPKAALSGNTDEARARSSTRKWSRRTPFRMARRSVVGFRSRS